MDLAILFWFYKESEICENRLKLLKKYNPNLKIYGFYGGEISEADKYKNKLCKYLDDFYIFTANTDEDWKWINGDLMILDWYEKRGQNLKWDSIIVVQWDMLVFDSLIDQFSGMKKDEIFISAVREIDDLIESKWDWVKIGSKERQNYLNFLNYVKKKYEYKDKPLGSLFILEILPRTYLEKYLMVEDKEVGMLEYKTPIYAQIFGIPFYQKDIGIIWYATEKQTPLNAIPKEIPEDYIKKQLAENSGWRIFHPYYKIWPMPIE